MTLIAAYIIGFALGALSMYLVYQQSFDKLRRKLKRKERELEVLASEKVTIHMKEKQ